MEDSDLGCYVGSDDSTVPLMSSQHEVTYQLHHHQEIDGMHYLVDGDDGIYEFKQSDVCIKSCDRKHNECQGRDSAIDIDTGCNEYPIEENNSTCIDVINKDTNDDDKQDTCHSTCQSEDNNINGTTTNEKVCNKVCNTYIDKPMETNKDGYSDISEDNEIDTDSEDEDYEDCDDYYQFSDDYGEDDANDFVEETALHHLLSHDIYSVKLWYGPTRIDVRPFSSLDDVDVDLKLDISFLHPEIASAWSLVSNQPLVVRLNFSSSRYLDGDLPKVTVFQPTKEKQVGICVQVRKITEGFLSTHWKTLSNLNVESKQKPLTSTTPKTIDYSGSKKFKNSLCVEETSLSHIMELGFSRTMATNALVLNEGQLCTAISFLQSNPARCQNFKGEEEIPRKKSLKKTLFRQKSSSSKPHSTEVFSPEELHLLPTLSEAGKTAKTIPSLCHGFLHQVFTYLRNRISSLNEYCVVCDEPHIFQNGYMLKPAVCERELCVFAFQTLGVMRNAAEDIAMGAEVVDLLVAMVASAVKSKRKTLILDPYPMVVDPCNQKEFAFSPKKKDSAGFLKIEKALDSFISIREMLATGDPGDMKKRMDIKDPNSYPLLQWIVSSNRSHIVKLPESRQIKFMHTPHQFLLMTSPPSKEVIFSKAKQESGSIFAFHGSHIENWHSILRKGLINASGTKYQVHGAAYGQGIYLSPHSSVSFGYSGMGHGFHRDPHRTIHVTNKKSDCRFLKSKNLTCIALCEVIESKELKKNGNIWVCTNPDNVCTRFFFVYEDGKVGDLTVDTSQDRYSKEILLATQVKTHPKTGKNILA